MKKILILFTSLMSATALLSAQNFMNEKFISSNDVSYEELLEGYENSNGNLERMRIKMEAAEISSQQTGIKNGVAVSLSTGNAKVEFDDTEGTSVSFTPSATVKVPGLNNLVVSASLPSEISDQGYEVQGTTVSASADIISSNRTNLKITNIESARSVQNARNNLKNQELGVEGEFLSDIQSIYDKASTLMSNRESYLDKSSKLEQVIVNGYSKNSSTYKIAQIEKDSAYNDCEKTYREFKSLLSELSAKCGYEIKYLISDIPDVEVVDFASFDMNSFSQIEQALYSKEMGELKRSANKNWTLSGNVKYNQSNNAMIGGSQSTIGAGIDTTWKGLGFGLGVDVPLSDNVNPSLNFNIKVDPMGWKSANLSDESAALDAKLEQLDVDDAYAKYNSSKRSYENQADNIMWEYELLKEQVTYYKSVSDDMSKAYKQGLINQSEYIKAENQYMKAYINLLKNKIKKFQYNLEVRKLFVNQE